jgi:hypothetical protein
MSDDPLSNDILSNDPVARLLSRFTPDSSALDRDALLFAAGRASVPPGRRWMALAGALAASQAVTLGLLLWSGQAPTAVGPPVTVEVEPSRQPAPEVPTPEASGIWRVFATDGSLPAETAAEHLMPPEPPLRAFGAPPAVLLN